MAPTAETRPCAIMMAAAPATDTKPVKISTRRGHLAQLADHEAGKRVVRLLIVDGFCLMKDLAVHLPAPVIRFPRRGCMEAAFQTPGCATAPARRHSRCSRKA